VLKLAAVDADDLKVISAHMQDALVRLSDIRYLSRPRKFAFVANRFAWEQQPRAERRRTGLHFEHVLSVKQLGIRDMGPDHVLSLLSIGFEPGAGPSGTITLMFSGGFDVRLEVECIDAQLHDLGAAWATENIPSHDG
jgi:Protein of unknown function (DUF2948)